MDRIRIYIADDTLIAREGWSNILETEDGIDIVGEASNTQEAIADVRKLLPDIILMDLLWFDDESAGLSAIQQIKQIAPQVKIIAVTAYRHLIAKAREAGAEAILPKGFSKTDLVNLIKAVNSTDAKKVSIERTSFTSTSLAVGIVIPIIGFSIIAMILMWGIRSLTIEKFLVAMLFSAIVYFFGVIFAGRYVGIISETTTYKLFLRILNILRLKLPNIPWRH